MQCRTVLCKSSAFVERSLIHVIQLNPYENLKTQGFVPLLCLRGNWTQDQDQHLLSGRSVIQTLDEGS